MPALRLVANKCNNSIKMFLNKCDYLQEEIEEARYADAARHRLSLQTEPSFGEEIEMESFGGTSSLEVLPDSVCDMDTDSFSDGQSYGSQQRLVSDKPPNSLRETAV